MAIKPVDNESFYREVDEELRRDQMTGTWKRYGGWIVAGVVLFLASIAGFLYWQNQKEVRAGEQAEKLISVFDEVQAGNTKNAAPKLEELAKEGTSGYRAAALLTKADMAIEEGKEAEAIASFKAVAEDDDLAAPYRELALIRQTMLEYDRLQPAVVIQRLEPLARPGNAWFGSAGDMVAIAYLRERKPAQAAAIFAGMAKDDTLPPSIRSRAMQMAGSLGVDAVQQSSGKGDGAAVTKE